MKIALGLEYSLALRGGVSVLVDKLIEGISRVHKVVLVSPDKTGFQHPGVDAHLRWDPAVASRKTSQSLASQLSELGVTLAHFHFGGAYGWGIRFPGQSPFAYIRAKGIPCITTSHMAVSILDGYCAQNKPLWFKLALLPLGWAGKYVQVRNVRAEIAVSEGVCQRLQRWYWPMAQKFQCMYHSRLPANQEPGECKSRRPLVLSVGHIALRKGQHILVEAFARIADTHRDWNLALIGHPGSDDCLNRIQKIISSRQLEDRVLLLGSREDTAEFMQTAGVFVQPAVYEGLPLALQEAMFYRCACIATRVIGNDELVDHEKNGLLVPALDAGALANALDKMIRNPSLRAAFGEAAVQSIRQKGMNAPTMVEKHLELYHTIFQRTRPCAAALDNEPSGKTSGMERVSFS